MKTVTNEKRIARNAKIGNWSTLAGLAALGVGLYISIKQPAYIFYSFVCLLVGILLSNVGLYHATRWVRRPRADEVLTTALKGFDKRYYLYNYLLPVNHVLLSPSGLFVIVARNQDGPIYYADGRWRQKFNLFRAFGLAGEAVGDPLRDAARDARKMQKFLAERAPQAGEVTVQALVVFTNAKADLHVQAPPLPVLDGKELKDHLRQLPKDALSGGQIRQMVEVLGGE
jgi:hypothetical protein